MHGGGGGWHGLLRATDERPRITRELLLRVLRYARPYRGRIAALLALILLTAGVNLLQPLIVRDLIDRTIPSGDIRRLVFLALALLAIPLVNGLVSVVQRRLNVTIGEGVIYDLRVALFARLQRLSLRFFTNTRVGELMSRLNNDVVGAQNAISNTLVSLVTNSIQAAAVLAVMLTLEWRLTLIGIAIMPLFLLVARRMAFSLRAAARRTMEANAQMNAMANETLNISGALLVKLFGRTDVEVQRFSDRAAQVRDTGIRRAVLGVIFFVIIGLLSAMGSALVYGLGGYMVIQGAFTIGTIVALTSYLHNLYGSLQGLANAPVDFATSMVSFERVFEVIDLPTDITEKPDAVALERARGALTFDDVSFRYEVSAGSLLSQVERPGQMDRVEAVLSGGPRGSGAGEGAGRRARGAEQEAASAAQAMAAAVSGAAAAIQGGPDTVQAGASAMDAARNAVEATQRALQAGPDGEPDEDDAPRASQAREDALQHISFGVQPGQLVALVGPSGAGKTTLTYLIPRLYDPTSGRVLIDGHDLRDVTLDSLVAQIGMVTQETHLFHDTIRTNLLYARLDATQEEVEEAARAANIHDFIIDLPDRYDTIVGERGYRLSGGEKQRIALARVILKDPRILVLDEATSSLDSESERLIQDALKRVMAGRTSIVIAHRLSTILAADLILVFNRGEIVERGAHADLLAQGGLYAQLYETQFHRARQPE